MVDINLFVTFQATPKTSRRRKYFPGEIFITTGRPPADSADLEVIRKHIQRELRETSKCEDVIISGWKVLGAPLSDTATLNDLLTRWTPEEVIAACEKERVYRAQAEADGSKEPELYLETGEGSARHTARDSGLIRSEVESTYPQDPYRPGI